MIRPRFLKMIYKLRFSTISIYYQHNITKYIYILLPSKHASACQLSFKSRSPFDLNLLKFPIRVLSSAYVIVLNNVLNFEMSFKYIINKSRPSIEPCGTPVVIVVVSDL